MARQLVIELVGKADKFTKSLDDAGKASSSFGDKIGHAGANMTKFVSVPIAGFLALSTKAAMDDAAAQAHLAETLGNTVGNSEKLVAQVEGYITAAQKASTFTDDDLRPSFENLVRVTHNAEDANHLLSIAMDVAAAKNISLETASMAVAKAHEGNFKAVNMLVPGLIDVKDKTLTADQAMGALATTFGGSAAAATETTAGKMQILKRDLGEASEGMGAKLLPAVTKFADFATNTLLPVMDKLTGGNGAFVLLGVAAAGPVLTGIVRLKDAIIGLNLTLDATAVKAAAALGAIGIVIAGIQTIKEQEGGIFQKILGPGPVSRWLDVQNPFGGGRAAGGPVQAGTSYLVGERGPELFTPGASGAITPSGGGMVVNLYVSSLDPAAAGPLVVRALDEYEARNGARYARA